MDLIRGIGYPFAETLEEEISTKSVAVQHISLS